MALGPERAATSRSGEPVDTAELAERFFALARALRAEANQSLRAEGFTFARGRLLMILDRSGPTRVKALAEALRITPRSVTEAVDALERDELVVRDPDPHDRRAVLVTLTERGAATVRDTAQQRHHALERVFTVLGTAQRNVRREHRMAHNARSRTPLRADQHPQQRFHSAAR